MDVLVIGSGAREHALAWRLARDEAVERVRIAPGNAGTAAVAEPVDDLDVLDPDAVARHAARERYRLVVIGPEGPLAAGVADALEQARVPVFAPTRAAARLESSKAYAKEQMGRAGVPTAEGRAFTNLDDALDYARASAAADRRLVVKADWLAAGKGVVVPESPDETLTAIETLFAGVAPGARVVLEERLDGREVSAFALVSGEAVVPLAAARDYKRLRDGDVGPNTGGMGAYSPVEWFDRRDLEAVAEHVFEPIAWRMARDETPYRGVLYAGLMVTDHGPIVLEFNARFGDPEAQVMLPLIEGDLAAALLGVANADRSLMEGSVASGRGAAVGVVLASEGYPDAPATGRRIEGAEPASPSDDGPLLCFHAATQRTGDGGYVTAGGRVVTFVGLGPTLGEAREAAYRGAEGCELEGRQVRRDIGAEEAAAAATASVSHLGDRPQLRDEPR
jgi:phosphoribosylamine--glycine ligase